jgi:23S rRNA G2445 N2-methylase RlmL
MGKYIKRIFIGFLLLLIFSFLTASSLKAVNLCDIYRDAQSSVAGMTEVIYFPQTEEEIGAEVITNAQKLALSRIADRIKVKFYNVSRDDANEDYRELAHLTWESAVSLGRAIETKRRSAISHALDDFAIWVEITHDACVSGTENDS